MLNLIKLELQKTRIRTYFLASIIISLCMLGLLYTFSAMSYAGDGSDAAEFTSYYNIMVLTNAINMTAFSVLASVMYTTFVIKEFSGKNAIMLFSYPIRRKSVMLAKIVLVSVFTIISLLVGTFLICLIWGLTESIFPLVQDSISISLVIKIIRDTLCMAVMAAGIGLISASIGFSKKSAPATIVSSIIICTFTANIVAAGTRSVIPIIGLTLAIVLVGIFALSSLITAANKMEV